MNAADRAVKVADVRHLVLKRLARADISWDCIVDSATEVILFGSSAMGCSNLDSDIDLLVVGDGERCKRAGVDIIWVTQDEISSQSWLGSELATHIATFGIWLKGAGQWRTRTFISDEAVASKAAKIQNRIRSLRRRWDELSPRFRNVHVRRLFGDVCRFTVLVRNIPVPPTSLLKKKVLELPDASLPIVREQLVRHGILFSDASWALQITGFPQGLES